MFEKYNTFRMLFDSWLKTASASNALLPALAESSTYSLLAPGKRLRPVLALASAELLDIPLEKVCGFALALEYVHVFSLVHDDLPALDNSKERRGQPSCHTRYGEARALLTGDSLLARAQMLVLAEAPSSPAPSERLSLALRLSKAVVELCDGQMLDLDFGKLADSELKEQLKICCAKKTAALITCAVSGPAALLAVDKRDNYLPLLTNFGHHLGFLFQITDDLLDARTEEKAARNSFVSVYGEEAARDYANESAKEAISVLSAFEERASFFRRLCSYLQHRDK